MVLPGRSRHRAVAALATLSAALLAGPAHAASRPATLEGETASHLRVTLTLAPNGHVASASIPWKTRQCDRRRATLSGTTTPTRPFSASTARSFVFRDRLVAAQDDTYLSTITVVVRGRRTGPGRWRGTIRASAVIRRGVKVFDHCRLSVTPWRAGRHSGRLDMTSDPGDWVGGGRAWSYSTPSSILTAVTLTGGLDADFAGPDGAYWTVSISRAHLRVGRFSGPNLIDVHGDGRSCGGGTGMLTVSHLRRDALGRVRAIDATFIQRCTSQTAALHGHLVFRRGF